MTSDDHAAGYKAFGEFYNQLRSAHHEQYRSKPHTKVRDQVAFDEQKHHLLSLYDGVTVAHSFVDSNGQTFDCIPIDQQPALKKSGRTLAHPPNVPRPQGLPPPAPQGPSPTLMLHPDRKDRLGNAMSCPPGTVAIRRITLDEMTRFETLGHFLRKTPGRSGHGTPTAAPDAANASGPAHEYAHAWQTIDNLGGHSFLNIWQPGIAADQTFSLSQQWYVATGTAGVQTAEVGWQVFPQKYGHDKPVLFTYWTADGYQHTGSYSTDAGDFIQYSPTCPVGIALDTISVAGGAQAEVEVTFLLSGGNWWLFINGTDTQHAVGYYPTSLYQNGPMATQATEIDYGGETVGNTSYPPMGSGAFANQGTGNAAYQRNIYYFPPTGGAQQAALTPAEQWPTSYTIQVQQSNEWGESFYFGGPGGAAPA